MRLFIRKRCLGTGPHSSCSLGLVWEVISDPWWALRGSKMRHFIKKKEPGHGPGPFPIVVGATTTRNNYA